MHTTKFFACFCPLLTVLAACSSDSNTGKHGLSTITEDGGDHGTADAATDDPLCPVVVKESDCDKTKRPFVFVHGTYGSGDNFAHVASLLGSNGYCQDRIVGVEYNSLGETPGADCTGDPLPAGCGKIDAVIDAILAKTGFDQVDLAGHSQGTAHCGVYLGVPAHAQKVAHYINFSGNPNVGDVDTLSLSSMHDLGMTPHHAVGNNVTEVTLTDEDHFAVAASTRSFVALYKYLAGKDAKYLTTQCGEEQPTIEGISESFADNAPILGKIEMREVGSSPGDTGALLDTPLPDSSGHFGPFKVKRNVAYAMKGFDADGKLIGYQYFTPFKRSNYLVRLLSPSSNMLISSNSTDKIVRAPGHVAVVARWAGGAFRQDLGASLKVNGQEVLTSENAGADAFSVMALNGGVVGFFMYDANKNKKTDLGLADSGPFLSFTDVYMDATSSDFINLEFKAGSEDEAETGSVKISPLASTDGTLLTMFQ